MPEIYIIGLYNIACIIYPNPYKAISRPYAMVHTLSIFWILSPGLYFVLGKLSSFSLQHHGTTMLNVSANVMAKHKNRPELRHEP